MVFSKPGKIKEFEKKAKTMEKSGNLIIPSEKIMGKIQRATQPLFKDKNHVFVVIMGNFCITSMLEKPGIMEISENLILETWWEP